jgi:hypothetical protein
MLPNPISLGCAVAAERARLPTGERTRAALSARRAQGARLGNPSNTSHAAAIGRQAQIKEADRFAGRTLPIVREDLVMSRISTKVFGARGRRPELFQVRRSPPLGSTQDQNLPSRGRQQPDVGEVGPYRSPLELVSRIACACAAIRRWSSTSRARYAAMKARRAGFTTSACVVHMPCGNFS